MAISPLPEATLRQLGAALAITSPVTLVKELLDNALDSGASSVTVTVSSNTVDRVEVRDNGHGINHGDFGALARCGHTSKLKTLRDLEEIGGNSLGFRGLALASATTLAEITVTTRIPEEPVAATLLLHEKGGATLQEPRAAPIGTTVLATSLFHKFPVRLRAAKQEATRTLQAIKRLLQSYALARSHVKMTFKILGAPSTAWQYTPGSKTTPKEAVLRVFGSELSSMCSLYQL
jgi:DNA mismatch repair protein MutL